MSTGSIEGVAGPRQVRDLMTRDVQIASPHTTLRAAATSMRTANIGFLPVVDETGPIGVVTDRDIVVRGLGRGLDPAAAVVMDVMTPNVASVLVEQDAAHAARLMRDRRIRRLVVVDDAHELAGVISLSDLVGHGQPSEWVVDVISASIE